MLMLMLTLVLQFVDAWCLAWMRVAWY